jgi:hypothetical protein
MIPSHIKQTGWQCALKNTSRSDRAFTAGDREGKFIILLSTKILSMTALGVF